MLYVQYEIRVLLHQIKIIETFEKRSFLFKVSEGENFNRRNI